MVFWCRRSLSTKFQSHDILKLNQTYSGGKISQTIDDLHNAFAGESQAYQKYTNFAKRAAAEGYQNIAKLFEATAEAERIHWIHRNVSPMLEEARKEYPTLASQVTAPTISFI